MQYLNARHFTVTKILLLFWVSNMGGPAIDGSGTIKIERTENNDVQGLQNVRSVPGEGKEVDVMVQAELSEFIGVVRRVIVAQEQTRGAGS
jgi:hypothetical protein